MGVLKLVMAIGLICEFFEGVENSIGAGIDRDRRAIAPCNRALSVEHEQRTFADAFACTIGAVFPCDLALGLEIGEQGKMQVAVTRKGGVAPYPVYRNAQQFRAVLVKFRKNFVVKRHLVATDRASVGGIKRQDDRLSPKIRERKVLIRGNAQREIRCNGSG